MRTSWKAAAAMALALAAAARAPASGAGEKSPIGARGVIEYLEGEVLLDGTGAVIGQEVLPGALIETAKESYCEVVFAGRNIFRIEPLSVARLEIDTNRSIELRQGAVAAVFQKLQRIGDGRGDRFRLYTPTAVAGVRGTAFYIRVEDRDNTYICTCNGSTRLADAAESFRRSVTSDRHKALRFSRSGDRIVAREAPLLYHDNSTMDTLAARIGSRIHWGEQDHGAGY